MPLHTAWHPSNSKTRRVSQSIQKSYSVLNQSEYFPRVWEVYSIWRLLHRSRIQQIWCWDSMKTGREYFIWRENSWSVWLDGQNHEAKEVQDEDMDLSSRGKDCLSSLALRASSGANSPQRSSVLEKWCALSGIPGPVPVAREEKACLLFLEATTLLPTQAQWGKNFSITRSLCLFKQGVYFISNRYGTSSRSCSMVN